MRAQLISWLKNDITPAVRQSRKPEQELLKFAHAQNLAPAQLEALAQLYNTAATVAYLDKSASRGGDFHIVEVPDLMKDYLKVRDTETKSAGRDAISFNDAWENTGILGNLDSLPKCFAGFRSVPVTWDNAQDHPVTVKLASAEPSKEERRRASELQVLVDEAKQAMFNLNEDLREELDGVRRLFRTWDPPAFEKVESDALLQHGEGMKAACDHAAKWLTESNIPVKRASGPGPRRLVRDCPLLLKFATIKELLEHRQAIGVELKGLEKRAAQPEVDPKQVFTNDDFRTALGLPPLEPSNPVIDTRAAGKTKDQVPPAGSRSNKPAPKTAPQRLDKGSGKGSPAEGPKSDARWVDEVPEKSEKIIGDLSSGLDSWVGQKSVIGDLFKDRFMGVINERNNKGQKTLDEGASNARRQAMLQQLLVTDDVLSEADPDHVVSLYNSLAQAMPEAASDPNVMRMALRSAIQHDGISPFDLKQMTDTETAGQQSGFNRKIQDALNYKGLDLQAPKHRK